MSVSVSQIIEDAKSLSAKERAFLARCLISSLDTTHDENVDGIWADLAKSRYETLKNDSTKTTSWEEIKKKVRQ